MILFAMSLPLGLKLSGATLGRSRRYALRGVGFNKIVLCYLGDNVGCRVGRLDQLQGISN